MTAARDPGLLFIRPVTGASGQDDFAVHAISPRAWLDATDPGAGENDDLGPGLAPVDPVAVAARRHHCFGT